MATLHIIHDPTGRLQVTEPIHGALGLSLAKLDLPDDLEGRPFVANCVISNPPTIGHIHVCEALGIPLHIMFPQPWYYGMYGNLLYSRNMLWPFAVSQLMKFTQVQSASRTPCRE